MDGHGNHGTVPIDHYGHGHRYPNTNFNSHGDKHGHEYGHTLADLDADIDRNTNFNFCTPPHSNRHRDCNTGSAAHQHGNT